MKKIFIQTVCLVLCLILLSSNALALDSELVKETDVITTQYKNKDSEDFLWEQVNKYSPSQELTAAILGFFWRESYYKSNAIANWSTLDKQNQKDNSDEFTKKVDQGLLDGSTKEYFIDQVHIYIGGYGLGQWHSKVYLSALYDYAQEWGTSIADAEMQCAFTVWSIYNQHDKHIKKLDTSSVFLASKWMGYIYDGSHTAEGVIYQKAKELYKIKNAE